MVGGEEGRDRRKGYVIMTDLSWCTTQNHKAISHQLKIIFKRKNKGQYFGGMKRGNVRSLPSPALCTPWLQKVKSGSQVTLNVLTSLSHRLVPNDTPSLLNEWMIGCTGTQRMIGMCSTALCLIMNKPVSPARLCTVWGKRPLSHLPQQWRAAYWGFTV